MLFGRKFDEITEGDITKLIEGEQEETLTLDFKESLGNNTKETAKNISSMANTEGGLIIYGIKEENNKAKEIKWIDSSENFKERLFQIINTTIVPRIEIKIYPINSNENESKQLYLVYVPKDDNNLYCVTKNKDNRFYIRDGNITDRMSPREIKDRIQLILEKQEKSIDYLHELKKDYHDASNIDFGSVYYFNITVIPDILNEKIGGAKLREILDSQYMRELYPNEGRANPCYKDSFIISHFLDNNPDYYKDTSIIHKNGTVERWGIEGYEKYIPSYLFMIILTRTLRFCLEYFKKIEYYGGFKIIITFRAYRNISHKPSQFGGDAIKRLQHDFIQEKIYFNQSLNLSEEEIKDKLKEFVRVLGSYAGLNLENFKSILDLLNKTITEICNY